MKSSQRQALVSTWLQKIPVKPGIFIESEQLRSILFAGSKDLIAWNEGASLQNNLIKQSKVLEQRLRREPKKNTEEEYRAEHVPARR